jgi:hypothetical protein
MVSFVAADRGYVAESLKKPKYPVDVSSRIITPGPGLIHNVCKPEAGFIIDCSYAVYRYSTYYT